MLLHKAGLNPLPVSAVALHELNRSASDLSFLVQRMANTSQLEASRTVQNGSPQNPAEVEIHQA